MLNLTNKREKQTWFLFLYFNNIPPEIWFSKWEKYQGLQRASRLKKKTPLKREENLRWKDAGTEEDRKGKWMLLLGTTFIISSKMYMSATKEMDMNRYEWIWI